MIETGKLCLTFAQLREAIEAALDDKSMQAIGPEACEALTGRILDAAFSLGVQNHYLMTLLSRLESALTELAYTKALLEICRETIIH